MIVSRRAYCFLLIAGFLAGISLCAADSAQAQQKAGSSPLYVGKTKNNPGKDRTYSLSQSQKKQHYETWDEIKARQSAALGETLKQDYDNKFAMERYAYQQQLQAQAYAGGGMQEQQAPAKKAPVMVYKPNNSGQNTQEEQGNSGGNRLWNKFWR